MKIASDGALLVCGVLGKREDTLHCTIISGSRSLNFILTLQHHSSQHFPTDMGVWSLPTNQGPLGAFASSYAGPPFRSRRSQCLHRGAAGGAAAAAAADGGGGRGEGHAESSGSAAVGDTFGGSW